MLLKQIILLIVDELEPLFSDHLESLLQTEDQTSVDSKKFFEDYLKKQSIPYNSEAAFSQLSKLNTIFYILYELKRNKIDANIIFLQSQDNKKNMKKLVEFMSKLKQKDLEELIKLNNRFIGNFMKN